MACWYLSMRKKNNNRTTSTLSKAMHAEESKSIVLYMTLEGLGLESANKTKEK